MLREVADERLWRRRAPNHGAHRLKFPTSGMFFQCIDDAHPDRRHATRYSNLFLFEKIEKILGVEARPGIYMLGSRKGRGKWKSPRIGVKHGHDREVGIAIA